MAIRIGLEKILSWLAVLTGIAYSLGWLKTFYYFDSFGIGLSSLDLSVQTYLFESWFVLENVVFFVILLWAVAKVFRWWTALYAVFYSLIPIAAHYAFLWQGSAIAGWLIAYRHTLLKFLPFLLYLILLAADRRSLRKTAELTWTHGNAALTLLIIVVAAWAISTAKHFGSYDASRAQMSPDLYLSKVRLHGAALPPAHPQDLYLIYAAPDRYFLWDHTDFEFNIPGTPVRIIEMPKNRVDWMESWKPQQIQPGSQFF